MTANTEDEKTTRDLAKAQVRNIHFLESWTNSQPAVVAGVNLITCLNYEVLQYLNQAFLKEYLQLQEAAS